MVGIQLQNPAHGEGKFRICPLHVLFHFKAHAGFRAHADGVAAQILGQLHFLHLLAQGFLHKGQEALHLLCLLLRFLLLFLSLQTQILGRSVAELLLHVGHQGLGNELVHILGKQQHIVALLAEGLHLRQLGQMVLVFTGHIVDLLLTFGHGFHIFLKTNQLALLMGPEQQQILAGILMSTVVRDGAVLQLAAKGGVELFVLLPVIFQHILQLGFDLLFNVPGNDGQLAALLQHFAADVQRQVLAVHHTPDKAEVLGQQILAGLHNHHTGGIQLQSPFEVLGIEVVGSLAGDVQQGLVADGTLGAGVDGPQGICKVIELVLIEGIVLRLGDILFGPLPDGHHGVQGLHIGIGFIFVGIRLLPGFGHFHFDGVADVVGIFADQVPDLILLQEIGELVIFRVFLQRHDDVGTGRFLGGFLNGIAVSTVRNPLPGGILTVLLCDDGDGGGHHEGGVEAHAELADDVDVLLLFHGLLEAQRTGLGNGAQVFFQFITAHADAVVGNGKGTAVLIPGDGDGKVLPGNAHLVIGQGRVGQLINGIGGIGDDLPQKDLPVGIDGVNHEVQQTLGLGFKLVLFHSDSCPFWLHY